MAAPRFDYRRALLLLLAVSAALRLVLIAHGGQYFWSDENRYSASLEAVGLLKAGQFHQALGKVIGTADHLGFKAQALLPAFVQQQWGGDDMRLSAALLSVYSLGNILWVWRLARRMGAGEREAFWAAAAMASSNCMFYWARHLMPYDAGLFWSLAAAASGLQLAPRKRDSLLAGLFGFLGFVTYNGCWATVACVLTAHVLLGLPNWKAALWRALAAGGVLAGSFVALIVAAGMMGFPLMLSYEGFAGTITQGNFEDGYVVFFDYLWRTERLTSLLWLAALGATLAGAWRAAPPARRRGLLWAAHALALMTILIVGSNVLQKFVVYGRLVRQVAPFCALLVGWAAARLLGEEGNRRREVAAAAAILGCGAWAMAVPLRMEFPVPFNGRASRVLVEYCAAHGTSPDKFRLLYRGFIWPLPKDVEGPLPAHYRVLLRSPHPLSWRPFLYEGFNREQRIAIESTDISMRLILLED
jgi:hypothetical protein